MTEPLTVTVEHDSKPEQPVEPLTELEAEKRHFQLFPPTTCTLAERLVVNVTTEKT